MIRYPIAIQKDTDTDYSVAVPDLPGCVTAGDTLDEAMAMAQEAIELHVEGMLVDGEPLPEPHSVEQHKKNPDFEGATWALVPVDPDAILAQLQQKRTWQFVAVLGEKELTDSLAEALFESGCDDGVLSSSGGVVQVRFDREATSLEQAIRSAIADIQKAGSHVVWVKIEPETLASVEPATPNANAED